jgi:hypothetical protein
LILQGSGSLPLLGRASSDQPAKVRLEDADAVLNLTIFRTWLAIAGSLADEKPAIWAFP